MGRLRVDAAGNNGGKVMGDTKVVYLSGFGRSGSTVVERVLGAVPGWVNVGELVDLARTVAPADERCGCGTPFSECPLWTEVGRLAFGGWTDAVLQRLAASQRSAARQRHVPSMLGSRTAAPAALRRLREDFARIYAAVAEVTGSQVVVDASKGPAFGLALAGAPGVDLRILNVVRDPRAVAWSWGRHVERPHATAGNDQMWRIPAHRAAAQWSALQLEVAAIARLARRRTARLRYEDFVADPTRSLVEATAALGLPLTTADLAHVGSGGVELGASHGLSGNPSRFRTGTVALRRDDGWLTQMPTLDRTVVTALTLPLATAYGYPLGRPSRTADPARHETRSLA